MCVCCFAVAIVAVAVVLINVGFVVSVGFVLFFAALAVVDIVVMYRVAVNVVFVCLCSCG